MKVAPVANAAAPTTVGPASQLPAEIQVMWHQPDGRWHTKHNWIALHRSQPPTADGGAELGWFQASRDRTLSFRGWNHLRTAGVVQDLPVADARNASLLTLAAAAHSAVAAPDGDGREIHVLLQERAAYTDEHGDVHRYPQVHKSWDFATAPQAVLDAIAAATRVLDASDARKLHSDPSLRRR